MAIQRNNITLYLHIFVLLGVIQVITAIQSSDTGRNINANATPSTSSSAAGSDLHVPEDMQKRTKKQSWSTWSEWSTCSRSCDGGVTYQLRICHAPQGCKGDAIRYKICNMQPCPDAQDFRAQQCAAYNDVPYDGALFKWEPHYDYSEPCALTCRGKPAQQFDENQQPEDQVDEYSQEEDGTVVTQLSHRVQDGTRCRPGSLDMCIHGKCQRVGCDLKIGSTKKIDACGVCGGDGSTCSEPLYQWEMAQMSLCSVTCGGGYKMSMPACRNRITGTEVEDSLCNASNKPEPQIVTCNTHLCPPKWIADEWGPCSKKCGGGKKVRIIVCAEESNGNRHRVPDEACRGIPPRIEEACNTNECPKWVPTEWSGCSVSCGTGVQTRIVTCLDQYDKLSDECDPKTKMTSTQECSTGIQCSSVDDKEDIETTILSSTPPSTQPTLMRSRLPATEDPDQDLDEEEEDEEMNSEEDFEESLHHIARTTAKERHVTTQEEMPATAASELPSEIRMQRDDSRAFANYYFNHDANNYGRQVYYPHQALPKPEKLVDQRVPSEATFVQDHEWSSCSATCGEGIRRRPYKCKIFLEFSKTVATLNDSLCHGIKPPDEVERCFMEPCSMSNTYEDRSYMHDNYRSNHDGIKVQAAVPGKTYSWREEGYTSCSASCLGGVEELIINCVRDDTGKVVSPFLCSQDTKPENRIRTCNDIPCPPRWNYSEYSPCSKSCGIGIKTREVTCIHEVTRGGENTMTVPNSMCPQPPPSDRQYCNVLDCPVEWETGEWSKCSKPCGGGYKERKVTCIQIMAQEHKVERPNRCPAPKPQDKKPCNSKPCAPEDQHPPILSSNTTFIQHDPKKSKITLKIGGAATVFFGTQIKIKCPVKRYNRTKIRWLKDTRELRNSKKHKVSKKGALRVLDVNFKDAGIYTCIAGLSESSIKLSVKPKMGDPMSSEEYERHHDNGDPRQYGLSYGPLPSEDRSHEHDGSNTNGNNNKGVRVTNRPRNNNRNRARHKNPEDLRSPESSVMGNDELLWPFQSFSNSRGHHLLTAYMNRFKPVHDLESNLNDEQRPNVELKSARRHVSSGEEPESDSDAKLPLKDVKFEWHISPWSACSQTCGANGGGYRLRAAHCQMHMQNQTQNVDNNFCEDAGLSVPETVEKCGNIECPRWETTEWTQCAQSKCFALHTALQRREVFCRFGNDTGSGSGGKMMCDESEMPVSKQECYSEKCKGVWRVEPWSECNAACNNQGIKYRILQCVWYGTKKPAGVACKDQPRPAVMKVCKGPPCISNPSDCRDISRYCKNVKSMGLCRLHRYQQQCCKSCRFNIFN
ncbi:protein madd-4 isoform X2 [Culicoides brevitarsis]|uniref:protein madd-4 isoform X2 n=1 Tax=Culicoides brevitarsis TaxID=469753 RepID=UPI00307C5AFE